MYDKTKEIILMFFGILVMIFFTYIALFGLYVDNYTGYYLICGILILIGSLIFGYGLILYLTGRKNVEIP